MDSSQPKAQKSQKDPSQGDQKSQQDPVSRSPIAADAHEVKPTEFGGGGVHVSSDEKKIAELEAKVASLTEQVKKLTDLAGRAQADLQNAKARLEKDGEESRKYAAQFVLVKLLPVIDNFQRAFSQLPQDLKDHPWITGMTATEQDLWKQVSEMGLKKMEALGQPADPQKHEILMTAPGDEGKVVAVLEDGYELHGKVIRPARVKVGDGSSTTAS